MTVATFRDNSNLATAPKTLTGYSGLGLASILNSANAQAKAQPVLRAGGGNSNFLFPVSGGTLGALPTPAPTAPAVIPTVPATTPTTPDASGGGTVQKIDVAPPSNTLGLGGTINNDELRNEGGAPDQNPTGLPAQGRNTNNPGPTSLGGSGLSPGRTTLGTVIGMIPGLGIVGSLGNAANGAALGTQMAQASAQLGGENAGFGAQLGGALKGALGLGGTVSDFTADAKGLGYTNEQIADMLSNFAAYGNINGPPAPGGGSQSAENGPGGGAGGGTGGTAGGGTGGSNSDQNGAAGSAAGGNGSGAGAGVGDGTAPSSASAAGAGAGGQGASGIGNGPGGVGAGASSGNSGQGAPGVGSGNAGSAFGGAGTVGGFSDPPSTPGPAPSPEPASVPSPAPATTSDPPTAAPAAPAPADVPTAPSPEPPSTDDNPGGLMAGDPKETPSLGISVNSVNDPTNSSDPTNNDNESAFSGPGTTSDFAGGFGPSDGSSAGGGGDNGGGGSGGGGAGGGGGGSGGGADGGNGGNGGGAGSEASGSNSEGYWQGGTVTADRLSGPPVGHDDGEAPLSVGEFVVRAPEAARYAAILQQINAGKFPVTTGATTMKPTIGPAARVPSGPDDTRSESAPYAPPDAFDRASGPQNTRSSALSAFPGAVDTGQHNPAGGSAPSASPTVEDDGEDGGGEDADEMYEDDTPSPLMPQSGAMALTPDQAMMNLAMLQPQQRMQLASALSDPTTAGALLTLLGPTFAPIIMSINQAGPPNAAPAMGAIPGAPPAGPPGVPAAPMMPPAPGGLGSVMG